MDAVGIQVRKRLLLKELEQCSTDIVIYQHRLEYLTKKRETLSAELKAVEKLEEI